MGCCSVCQQSCRDWYQYFLVCFCREGVLCGGVFCVYIRLPWGLPNLAVNPLMIEFYLGKWAPSGKSGLCPSPDGAVRACRKLGACTSFYRRFEIWQRCSRVYKQTHGQPPWQAGGPLKWRCSRAQISLCWRHPVCKMYQKVFYMLLLLFHTKKTTVLLSSRASRARQPFWSHQAF